MSLEEFEAWHTRTTIAAGGWVAADRRTHVPVAEALGMSTNRARGILRGETPITKTIALACAHVDIGRAVPIPMETEAFQAWFSERFVSPHAISKWMEVNYEWLCNMLRGFRMAEGVRVPIKPTMVVVRALDWIWSIGPVVPYGERAPIAVAPGTEPRS